MEGQIQNLKKVYFITGLGCSGKTTFANQLGVKLGYPVFHADSVYALVQQKLGISREELTCVPELRTWEDKNFDWKEYKTPEALLELCYNEMFSYNPPAKLIIEGEALFYNPREQALVQKMFLGYDKRFIVIEPDYEQWLKFRSKRETQAGEFMPPFREENEYIGIQQAMKKLIADGPIFTLRDFPIEFGNPTGQTDYQYEEFSNPKWEAFKFPDLKGKTFMDVSCNTGWFCRKAFEAGAEVSGLEMSWEALDLAIDRVPRGTFYHTKIEDWRPTRTYDYVLCASAFHYYHHREEQIAKFAEMTDNLTIEMPLIDTEDLIIRYQGGSDGEFCSVISLGLLLKWLNKYFTKVELIGNTLQVQGAIAGTDRPVYRATK